MELAQLPTNTGIDEYDWPQIFRGSERWRIWPGGEQTEPLAPSDVAEVLASIGHCGCQKLGFCQDYCHSYFYGLVRLHGGQFAAFEAWNDTTGWGCMDGVEWGIAADRDTVWKFGLSDEGREALANA